LVQEKVREKLPSLEEEVKGQPKLCKELEGIYKALDLASIRDVVKREKGITELFREVAIPVENAKKVKLEQFRREDFASKDWAASVLENYTLIGLDTSEVRPSIHYSPAFLLVNVGYQLIRYGKGEHKEGSVPFLFTVEEISEESFDQGFSEWMLEVYRLKLEREVLKELMSKELYATSPGKISVLLDESLCLSYLASRPKGYRVHVAREARSTWNMSYSRGALFAGVYYTGANGFVLSIVRGGICFNKPSCSFCMSQAKRAGRLRFLPCVKYSPVRDRFFFNRLLDVGERSPVFKVSNKVTEDFGLDVYAFYLKVEENNVVRVEFVGKCDKRRVERLHTVVLAQSILGNGYPYVLERAHEQAVVRSYERRWIYSYISRLLSERGVEGLAYTSKKERMKRGGIA